MPGWDCEKCDDGLSQRQPDAWFVRNAGAHARALPPPSCLTPRSARAHGRRCPGASRRSLERATEKHARHLKRGLMSGHCPIHDCAHRGNGIGYCVDCRGKSKQSKGWGTSGRRYKRGKGRAPKRPHVRSKTSPAPQPKKGKKSAPAPSSTAGAGGGTATAASAGGGTAGAAARAASADTGSSGAAAGAAGTAGEARGIQRPSR